MTPPIDPAFIRADLARSRDAVEAVQRERLRWSLAHAYQGNPALRAAWDAAGVRPEDIREPADLARAPFATKADLRAAYPFGYFAVPADRIARVHASSGTTGQPTVVGYTRDDLATWAGLVARSIFFAGGRPGMRAHVAYGYGLFTGGLGAHYGAEALGLTVIPMSGGQTERQVRLIQDFAPYVILVTPSYMLAVLDGFRAAGADPAATALRIGIFGAEPWGPGVRAELEGAFGLKAHDIYGLSEVIGPGVAQEGEAQVGPTLWEDHFLPEIVDPATGCVLPDGEQGELVITSLTKQAMPVVRYRTRDLTCLLPGAETAMRRLAPIRARSDDMLIVRGVNVFPSQLEEQIARAPALSAHWLLELTREERLDCLTVRVEARDDGCDRAREAAALASRIKEMVGVTATVDVATPGALPRSQGKAQRVLDRR